MWAMGKRPPGTSGSPIVKATAASVRMRPSDARPRPRCISSRLGLPHPAGSSGAVPPFYPTLRRPLHACVPADRWHTWEGASTDRQGRRDGPPWVAPMMRYSHLSAAHPQRAARRLARVLRTPTGLLGSQQRTHRRRVYRTGTSGYLPKSSSTIAAAWLCTGVPSR